jgi:hypothetical protein
MNERVKKMGLTILSVIAILAVIAWQFSDRNRKEAILSESLDLLGQKLISLVPDQAAKNDLELLFNDFREKAVQGLLGPKEVEQVAANILNVENAGDTLTRAQAASILPFPLLENVREQHTMAAESEAEKWRPGERRELGERLYAMLEFNERVRRELPRPPGHPRGPKKFHFRADSGLVVHMDPELLKSMAESKRFEAHVRKMEKLHMIRMQKEIEREIQVEMDSLAKELQQMNWGQFRPPAIPEIRIEAQVDDSTRVEVTD